MAKVHYTYVRGLELTGYHPASIGEWLVTIHRLRHGEGEPSEDDPQSMLEFDDGAPLPPTSKIPSERLIKTRAYRRIRSSDEGVAYMKRIGRAFQCCLHTFASWAMPKDGYIPLPEPGQPPGSYEHCVPILTLDEFQRRFGFKNSWGPWGLNNIGLGFIDFEYVDRYGFEAWALYEDPVLGDIRFSKGDSFEVMQWVMLDEHGRSIHGIQVVYFEAFQETRMAWAFILETPTHLELEELYVLPAYRGRGYSKILTDAVNSLVSVKQKPLRMWVPFADTKEQAPATYQRLLAVGKRLNVRFVQCPTIWAAYFGATDIDGEAEPVSPANMPGRPQSRFDFIVLAALSLMPDLPAHEETPSAVVEQFLPDIESEAWRIMNRIRDELITKQYAGKLDDTEEKNLERLQYISYEVLRRRYPVSTKFDERLRKLEERLGEK